MTTLDGKDVQSMVDHWLHTPVNGYLGSSYGQDVKALLQNPQAAGLADDFLAKLRTDVPMLAVLPPGTTNLYGIETPPDRLDLVIEVAGTALPIPEV